MAKQYYEWDEAAREYVPSPPPRARPAPKADPAPPRKPPRKKLEFSQKTVIASWVIVIAVIAGCFILAYQGKQQIAEVGTTAISIFGGFVTGGYFALTGARSWSENKYGRQGKRGDADVTTDS